MAMTFNDLNDIVSKAMAMQGRQIKLPDDRSVVIADLGVELAGGGADLDGHPVAFRRGHPGGGCPQVADRRPDDGLREPAYEGVTADVSDI